MRRMRVFARGFMAMRGVIIVMVCVSVIVRVGVAVIVRVLVIVAMAVGVMGKLRAALCGKHVDLDSSDAAAHHTASFETRAYLQRRCGLGQHFQRHARIDHGAEQHVATDARKAIKIPNAHRSDSKLSRPRRAQSTGAPT